MTSKPFGAAIFGCDGARLSPDERAFFADANPFGFILFDRNLETPEQIRALTADLRDAVGWNAPIFIDQEGGRVQRLRAPLATEWLPPLDQVERLGSNAAEGMRLRYRIIAHELRTLGIDANCAPMLDVARSETHPFLRNRCYGSNLDQVVKIGRAVVEGHEQGGVFPVIKHIPGHGLAQMDSHLELPRIDVPAETLDDIDFAAFRPFADVAMGMTAHLVYRAFGETGPATTSPSMIRRIRDDIGFTGLLMTDDIGMQALSGTVPERGAASMAAGCDVILHCIGDLAERIALMERIGAMPTASQHRAEAAIARRTTPQDVDIAALTAKLAELEQGRGA
ncbi:glycoside hydrolase family 3 N-terminal domain-containing protein [Marivita sp. XM-24bin2]|uniref:glycoside hydrolase family 3 N-terminal domain-containing protein n=1 Tax=unclassified Marivita TaxID=2632480 RepID=UPI000D78F57B|nr:glycoside hydrolase family 3 N-terminal domain-containing protein [Marivita sp. XM-24bin2]MCR9110139.1 beta-hexosaminidase [Paracoccaceae bacterium]PWL34627.1 MAG: beta-hexosaminidase [Marivita sp. XM-24bin2]